MFIKWPLGRVVKLGDDIKMGLREINCECGNRIELTQDHVYWLDLTLTMLTLWSCL